MSNATRAGAPLTIDGVQYELSPLTFEDIEFLEMWAKSQAIAAGNMSVPKGVSQEEYNRRMAPVLDRADKISLFDQGLDAIMTASGIVQMIHRMVQHKHPNVGLHDVKLWCSKEDLLQSMMSIIQLLFPKGAAKRGAPTKRRAKPKRSTARK